MSLKYTTNIGCMEIYPSIVGHVCSFKYFIIDFFFCQILEKCPDVRWHFIGHLQRNKVNKVLGKASWNILVVYPIEYIVTS